MLEATTAASSVQVPKFMEWLVSGAEALTGFFSAAGEEFMGWASGIIPMALVALTVLNAIVSFIGEDRFDRFARKLTKNFFTRYTVLPYLANFFVGSPSCFIFGKYLQERYKPAYYEVCNRTNMAPLMCLFPHVNPAELFVWLGIYNGVVQGYGTRAGGLLAVATFIIALVTSSINGLIVEKITMYIAKRKNINWDEVEARKSSSVA